MCALRITPSLPLPQLVSAKDYASGSYMIDGEPVFERSYVTYQYGSRQPPKEGEIEEKARQFFTNGLAPRASMCSFARVGSEEV